MKINRNKTEYLQVCKEARGGNTIIETTTEGCARSEDFE